MTLTIDDLKTEHSFQGTWITDKTIPYDRKKSPVPLCVRKTFTLKKKLRRAMLYATAVGSYYVTVNGEKITAEMLAPGYTSYAKYLQYQAYECFFLRILTVRKVCGGNQPATAGF